MKNVKGKLHDKSYTIILLFYRIWVFKFTLSLEIKEIQNQKIKRYD